ncbi:MAG: hypothetical protein KIH03_04380 [Paludibacteraceae bacterium]|nr:hypothetical protein [Paludibacteraceae bacterium]
MKGENTMSKEINKVEEIEEVTEEEVVETETKKGFVSKIVGFGKKHGKKIVTGVAVAAVGMLGYALGKKTHGEEDDFTEDDEDLDCVEFD